MKIAGYATIATLLLLPSPATSDPDRTTGSVVQPPLSTNAKGKVARLDAACLTCTPAAVSFTIDTKAASCTRFTLVGGGGDDVRAAYAMLLTAASGGKSVAFKASWGVPQPPGAVAAGTSAVAVAEGSLGSKTHCLATELRLE